MFPNVRASRLLVPALICLVLLVSASSSGAQEVGEPVPTEAEPAWALSLQFSDFLDGVYGGWRRVLPGLLLGIEVQAGWAERSTEVDRLDRPGDVNASSTRDATRFSVGPSVRWRLRPEAEFSPSLRAHVGYLRERIAIEDDRDDVDEAADGVGLRGSVSLDYRASRHLDVSLGLGARWSRVKGNALFHVNETVRTTSLDLLVPTVTFLFRF